jgi:hypothetical protein
MATARADLIFQNTSGQIYLWYMNGSGGISSGAYLFTGSLGDWRVAGIADLNSDSNADVIFQNAAGNSTHGTRTAAAPSLQAATFSPADSGHGD